MEAERDEINEETETRRKGRNSKRRHRVRVRNTCRDVGRTASEGGKRKREGEMLV